MAASSMFRTRKVILIKFLFLVLVPCSFVSVSAELAGTEAEEIKTVPPEAPKESTQLPQPSESVLEDPPPITEKVDQSEVGTGPTDDESPTKEQTNKEDLKKEEEEVNSSPLTSDHWSSQIFGSITDGIRYVFTMFMSELQKEIDFYSYKEEPNITDDHRENNETAVSVKEPPPTVSNSTEASNATQESGVPNESERNETSVKKPRFHCTGKNITENTTGAVQMVNGTTLLQRLAFENNASGSECVLVFFYAPWCHFSALAASSYNTLGRAYPQLDIVAVDAVQFSNLNARFGVVSVPNIIFFHQSRSVVRFNSSKKTFENMVLFVKNMTGLESDKSVEVSEQDLIGPISSIPKSEPDYLLWLAWAFINVCSLYMFYVSSLGQQLINKVHTLWQEHQHIE